MKKGKIEIVELAFGDYHVVKDFYTRKELADLHSLISEILWPELHKNNQKTLKALGEIGKLLAEPETLEVSITEKLVRKDRELLGENTNELRSIHASELHTKKEEICGKEDNSPQKECKGEVHLNEGMLERQLNCERKSSQLHTGEENKELFEKLLGMDDEEYENYQKSKSRKREGECKDADCGCKGHEHYPEGTFTKNCAWCRIGCLSLGDCDECEIHKPETPKEVKEYKITVEEL